MRAGDLMSETDIARLSREAISKLGIPCERVNSGSHRVKRGYLHLATKGTPDCWSALGWLEFKLPGEKLSPEQQAWHRRAKTWGVRVEVSHSVEETVAIVKRWLEEREHARSMGWL
jgi:hypothetical protein